MPDKFHRLRGRRGRYVSHHRDTPLGLVDDDLVERFVFLYGHGRAQATGATDEQTVDALVDVKLYQATKPLFVDAPLPVNGVVNRGMIFWSR